MSVKIQYASDLHLEVHPTKFRRILTPSAEILVLAGDIGHPFRKVFSEFLKWCSDNFTCVVFVPGNHEYHGSSLITAQKKMKKICAKHGVYFLDRDVLELPEYELVILGTTLWSEIPSSKTFEAIFSIGDYSCIAGLSVPVVNDLYQLNKRWLRRTINFYRKMNPEYKICVVSHHAPLPKLTIPPKYRQGDHASYAYASDCSSLLPGVWLWIYGHTHYNNTFQRDSVIITSNQRGYPGEITTYHKDQYVTLEMVLDTDTIMR